MSRPQHGMAGTPLYRKWWSMVARCCYPSCTAYPNYGGRGISVCAEWRDFRQFRDWALGNGFDPALEIDRIDNAKGYSPDNCRFVTRLQNARNKPGYNRLNEASATRIREMFSQGVNQREIARQIGVHYGLVWCVVRNKTWVKQLEAT